MNISIKSLNLTEDIVSDVVILRIVFIFSIAISPIANKRLLKKNFNIPFVKVSAIAGPLILSHYIVILLYSIWKTKSIFIRNTCFQSPSPRMLLNCHWIVSMKTRATVHSISFGKTFFAWRFILDDNLLFWLIISYQKSFVISVSLFCSQILTLKFNLWPKVGLNYATSIVKWFFFNFLSKKIIYLLFFAEFELLMFHNNIVKISEKIKQVKLVENLPPSYLPYRFLHDLASFLLWEKVKIFYLKKKQWLD